MLPYYDAHYEPYENEHGVDGFAQTLGRARASGELRHVPIRPGLRLLDVGCGGGVFLRMARDLGASCVGVEPSEHGARVAAAAGLDVFHGTLTQFIERRPQSRFDLITSNHVVEHHPDPIALLAEMKSLLSDSGTVWIAVPNGDCGSARVLTWRWHSTDLPYHLHHFSRNSLRVAVQRAGLALESMNTESMPHAVLSSLQSELRHTWKLPVRLTQRLPLRGVARRRARAMDTALDGEAILVSLRLTYGVPE
ncbi:MAG: class I SAM-dependent methyltransferase, partial [Aquincola sp.]|nr:class I SAM-dependent methyltransferase [Aquincola sp.]